MKVTLLLAAILLTLGPGMALAERPATTNLKQQVILLTNLVESMSQALEDTQKQLAATQAELNAVKSNTVLGLDGVLSLVTDSNGYSTVQLSGANLQVVNGLGSTDTKNGLGNIILGYNTSSEIFVDRQGSHNLVLGDDQAYPETAALLTGNILSSQGLTVVAAEDLSVLAGGDYSTTVASNRSVSVGKNRTVAIGQNETISVGVNQ